MELAPASTSAGTALTNPTFAADSFTFTRKRDTNGEPFN